MAVYSVTTEGVEAITTAAETLVQLIGSTSKKARIIKWGVSFGGTNAADTPVTIELARQTTAGTSTGATEVSFDPDDGAATVTGFNSFTAEPTKGSVLECYYVHPQGGGIVIEYPPGREPQLQKSTSDRLGVIVQAGQAQNAEAFIEWEE